MYGSARFELWVRGAQEHTRPVAGTVDPSLAEDQGLLVLDVAQSLFQALLYVRTYVSPDPAPLHTRTYVRTYVRVRTYAATAHVRRYVRTYFLSRGARR